MVRRLFLSFVSLSVVAVLLALGGCSGGSAGENPPGGEKPTASADGRDDALVAFEAASTAVKEGAPDALLLSAGSQGVALADVPSTWSFIFLARDTGHLWRVVVDHGKASAPEDLGQSKVPIDASTALDLNVVSVWAEQAITMARGVAAGSGNVPPNVVVMGGFMELPGATGGDSVFAIWKIAFIEGTSMEGAREFTVNMVDGQILEVTE